MRSTTPLTRLRVAGYLLDISKITIPAEILSKPGKLSPIEYERGRGTAYDPAVADACLKMFREDAYTLVT